MAARSRANRADFPIGTAYGIFCLESIDPFLLPLYARKVVYSNPPSRGGARAEPVPVTERLALIEVLADPKRLASPNPYQLSLPLTESRAKEEKCRKPAIAAFKI